jgi:hypothetical protein
VSYETVVIATWLVIGWYSLRAGGPGGVWRALRDPGVSVWWKVALLVCLLPIPGQLDNIIAAAILRRLSRRD